MKFHTSLTLTFQFCVSPALTNFILISILFYDKVRLQQLPLHCDCCIRSYQNYSRCSHKTCSCITHAIKLTRVEEATQDIVHFKKRMHLCNFLRSNKPLWCFVPPLPLHLIFSFIHAVRCCT